MAVEKGTIIRTVLLALGIINTFLGYFGIGQLDFDSNELYEGMSIMYDTVVTIIAWWKNNSFSKPAIQADLIKDDLKKIKEVIIDD